MRLRLNCKFLTGIGTLFTSEKGWTRLKTGEMNVRNCCARGNYLRTCITRCLPAIMQSDNRGDFAASRQLTSIRLQFKSQHLFWF